jgi:flavorubredoxin
VLFDEANRVLFCSDLFHQLGQLEPITSSDVVGRWADAVATYQNHPVLMDYVPFTPQTRRHMEKLASLQPQVLAAMHGSTFVGDGGQALRDAAVALERLLGAPVAIG